MHAGKLGRIFDTHRTTDLWFHKYVDKAALRVSLAGKAAGATGRIVHPAAPNWAEFPTPNGSRPKPDRDPLGNIEAGDCVFAAPGHQGNMIGQQVGDPKLVITTEMVLAAYKKYAGYNPLTGYDPGFRIRDMIEIASTEGLFGMRCVAACAVDKADQELVAAATWAGCGLIGGYDLPEATETQGDLWSVPQNGWGDLDYPGKRGGHAMYKYATSPAADAYITWGDPQTGTNGWRHECCSELWLIFWDKWITATGRAPNGIALADLLADWRAR